MARARADTPLLAESSSATDVDHQAEKHQESGQEGVFQEEI